MKYHRLNTERITEADMELKPDGRLLANYTECKYCLQKKLL